MGVKIIYRLHQGQYIPLKYLACSFVRVHLREAGAPNPSHTKQSRRETTETVTWGYVL